MPEKWNQHALKDLSYKGGILRTDDQLLNAYTPDTEMGFQGEFPVALYTDRTNSRIVAQQGVFVVFGKEKKPMEVIYHENNFPDFSLAKIIIPRTEVVQMLDDLLMMGITESVIFPDLSGFSAEVIRRFKLR